MHNFRDSCNPSLYIKIATWVYIIELPDRPHCDLGIGYCDKSKCACAWFRIRGQWDRYLHTGSISAGCPTVTYVEKWDNLYDTIIWYRKDGDDNVHRILEIKG